MPLDSKTAILLEPTAVQKKVWTYPWIGLLLGALVSFFIVHPITMLVLEAHYFITYGRPFDLMPAFLHSFHGEMWPMMVLYSLLGAAVGGVLGFILKRLKENRLRLDTLHQEFEIHVATLRHHYKNLAIGIEGFAGRIKRKLGSVETQLLNCAMGKEPGTSYEEAQQECQALAQNVAILEEAAHRLTQTLGQELLFLKALTSDSLAAVPRDFYPLLRQTIRELLDLRFREKNLQVEVNGQPFAECQDSLVFPFETYSMEAILQNILSNGMKYGDRLQIRVEAADSWIRVAVADNGPGFAVDWLKKHLLAVGASRERESTHLGLKVTLHLLEKCGGRLWMASEPGAGAVFIIEVPKQPEARG
jgi:signal transduction histidine kinase